MSQNFFFPSCSGLKTYVCITRLSVSDMQPRTAASGKYAVVLQHVPHGQSKLGFVSWELLPWCFKTLCNIDKQGHLMQSGLGDSRNISDPLIGEKKKTFFPQWQFSNDYNCFRITEFGEKGIFIIKHLKKEKWHHIDKVGQRYCKHFTVALMVESMGKDFWLKPENEVNKCAFM